MKYRLISFDGSRGWRLGRLYDLDPEPNGTLMISEQDGPEPDDIYEQTFFSRNNDGLFESEEEGMSMLVPIEGDTE